MASEPWLIEGSVFKFSSDRGLDVGFLLRSRGGDHIWERLSEAFKQLIGRLLGRLSVSKHDYERSIDVGKVENEGLAYRLRRRDGYCGGGGGKCCLWRWWGRWLTDGCKSRRPLRYVYLTDRSNAVVWSR